MGAPVLCRISKNNIKNNILNQCEILVDTVHIGHEPPRGRIYFSWFISIFTKKLYQFFHILLKILISRTTELQEKPSSLLYQNVVSLFCANLLPYYFIPWWSVNWIGNFYDLLYWHLNLPGFLYPTNQGNESLSKICFVFSLLINHNAFVKSLFTIANIYARESIKLICFVSHFRSWINFICSHYFLHY